MMRLFLLAKLSNVMRMTNEEDGKLVRACQAGNAEAFGRLYDGHVRKIYDFIYYRTHHRETAEDLTGDVFMKAFAALPGFDAEKGSFSSWIYRIARNRVIDHYRTIKHADDIADVWDVLRSGEDVNRDAETRELLRAAEKLVAQLPPVQRDVVIMRAWDQLSYVEIAEILGKSEAACKMSFSRAVASLRPQAPLALLLAILLTPLR